jgi:probable rRNA maturation factor
MDAPEIVIAVEAGDWPPEPALAALARRAVEAAVAAEAASPAGDAYLPQGRAELSLLFTNDEGICRLNRDWRGRDRPTNVLSFPQPESPPGAEPQPQGRLLGDVILAAETVAREAALAEKPLEDHMAHLIIHGFLHLLGHDHETDPEAELMEQLERIALARLGIPDPYATARGR